MAISSLYEWIPSKVDNIALRQDSSNNSLVLNGSLGAPAYKYVKFVNWERNVFITSAGSDDMTGVTFTIRGQLNGRPEVFSIAGPGPGLRVTTNGRTWHRIDSITTDGPVTDVQVGAGDKGQTNWFRVDDLVPFSGLGVQVALGAATFTYTFMHSTFDMTSPLGSTPFAGLISAGIVVPQPNNAQAFTTLMAAATTSQYAALMTPTRYCGVAVGENTPFTNNLLWVQYVHQGLRA